MPTHIKLIIGLGNPGPEYTATRHNAGFWLVDRLADKQGGRFTHEKKFSAELARVNLFDKDCRLLKPQTFMNNSGLAAQAIMNFFKIEPDEVLVAHDEIDFEPGKVRLKNGGGHAGHNGLRDIISTIGSNQFLRLRIGVGHPGQKEMVIGSVLSRPSQKEMQLIDEAIEQALDIMPYIMDGEINKAMTILNSSEKDNVESEE